MIFERDRLAVGKARYSLQNAGTFKEEDHPRGEGGQFGTGGGGEGKSDTPKKITKVKIQDIKPGDVITSKGKGALKGVVTKRGSTWIMVKDKKGEENSHPISSLAYSTGLEITREE